MTASRGPMEWPTRALGSVLASGDDTQAVPDSPRLHILQKSHFCSQIWKPNVNLLSKMYLSLVPTAFITGGGQQSLLTPH